RGREQWKGGFVTAEEGAGRNMGRLSRGVSVPVQCLVAQPRGERHSHYKQRGVEPLYKRAALSGAKLSPSRRGGWRASVPITAPQFQFSLVNLVPNCRKRPTRSENLG